MEYYEGDDEEDGEGSFRIEEKENKTKESVKKTGEGKDKGSRKRVTSAQLVERAIGKSMLQMTKIQEESDERFIGVEEKRLKFDERVFEVENEKCREERERQEQRHKEDQQREEQRRREEREFQLKV